MDTIELDSLIGPKPPLLKLRYSHDAMIDLLISDPWISQNGLAAHFGYSPAWVSTILSSDAFQAKLAMRREEIIDPALRLSTAERFKAVVDRSFAILQEKLSAPAHLVSDNVALRAAEMGAKVMVAQAAGQIPQRPPVGDRLAELAKRLVELKRGTDIEGVGNDTGNS